MNNCYKDFNELDIYKNNFESKNKTPLEFFLDKDNNWLKYSFEVELLNKNFTISILVDNSEKNYSFYLKFWNDIFVLNKTDKYFTYFNELVLKIVKKENILNFNLV